MWKSAYPRCRTWSSDREDLLLSKWKRWSTNCRNQEKGLRWDTTSVTLLLSLVGTKGDIHWETIHVSVSQKPTFCFSFSAAECSNLIFVTFLCLADLIKPKRLKILITMNRKRLLNKHGWQQHSDKLWHHSVFTPNHILFVWQNKMRVFTG